MRDPAPFFELRVRVAAACYAALEILLEDRGALAITRGAGDSAVFDEPGVSRAREWTSFTVSALFPAGTDGESVSAALRRLLGQDLVIERTTIADRPWPEAWKQEWAPREFPGGLWICPTWREAPATATRVVRLDPGAAFGTGAHATTALCLEWLTEHGPFVGRRILDYGCGSGILALAAARLGAPRVDAVDIDAEARAVARANVELNGLTGMIRIGSPEALAAGCADVVLANILLEPLLALAPRFAELAAPGASVVLSGILVTQLPRVLAAYEAAFAMQPPRVRGEWALTCGRRRGASA